MMHIKGKGSKRHRLFEVNSTQAVMKIKLYFIELILLALSTLNSQLSTAHAQGTVIMYQGQPQNDGSPVSGTYNLTFGAVSNFSKRFSRLPGGLGTTPF